ncbi:FHA domain-containing protein [Microbacterium sp. GXF7504]
MTERVWLDGALPAVATETWAVLATGRGAVPAARRILALPADTASPAPVLDALVADGVGTAPGFALVALVDGRLTAFLRGPFALRIEHEDGGAARVDGYGVHSWREVVLDGVQRAWVLQSPAITRTDAALRATPVRPGPTTASGLAMRTVRAVAAATPPAITGADGALPDGPPRCIELPDGARVPIEGELLIGRGPRTDRLDAAGLPVLVVLDRAPRELSRTHVRVRRDGDEVRIEDLGGAGGTALTGADGVPRRLRAAEPVPVAAGQTAELPGGVRIRFLGDA